MKIWRDKELAHFLTRSCSQKWLQGVLVRRRDGGQFKMSVTESYLGNVGGFPLYWLFFQCKSVTNTSNLSSTYSVFNIRHWCTLVSMTANWKSFSANCHFSQQLLLLVQMCCEMKNLIITTNNSGYRWNPKQVFFLRI